MTNLPERERALALLEKYRTGKCTPDEISRVERWYNALDDSANINSQDIVAINDATERILSLTQPDYPSSSTRIRKITIWVSIAASLLVGIGMVGLFLHRFARTTEKFNETYTTANGHRKEIHLPDGSVINLNVASTLKLLNFDKSNRFVSLTGEAFFHIAKDRLHPFIICTGKIQTRVLGTSFDVFAYPGEPVIRVAVANGKVQVEDSKNPHKILGKNMTKDNIFSYSTINGAYSLTIADVDKSDAWLFDRLNFSKATIGEIGRSIQRNFNIPVSITGQHIEDIHFTVKFERTDLDKILNQLSALTGVQCSRTKNGVVIDTNNL